MRPVARVAIAITILTLLGLSLPQRTIAAGPQISVVPSQPVPGQQVTVRGSGFCPSPCSAVSIQVDGSVADGAVTVAKDGTFEADVALTPVSGTSTIVASQTEGGGDTREATAIVRIVAADLTPGPAAPPAPPDASVPPGQASPPAAAPTAPPSGSLAATTGPQISVVPSQPVPGQPVTVRGSGFCPAPCSDVTLRVDGAVANGAVAVAADGTFSAQVGLTPVSGTSTIVASQTDQAGAAVEATAMVHVVASDATGGSSSAPPPDDVPAANSPGSSAWLAVAAGAAALILLAILLRNRVRR